MRNLEGGLRPAARARRTLANIALATAAVAAFLALPAQAAAIDEFGFNEDLVAHYGEWADAQKAAGATNARITLSWQRAEPWRNRAKQSWWQEQVAAYNELRARGIRPLYTLAFAPDWAREPDPVPPDPDPYAEAPEVPKPNGRACGNGDHCTYPPAREWDHRWASFVYRVASALPEADFEIWNEPNGIFWQGGHDPQRYAELVTIASQQIKQASPSSKVYICGCSSPVFDTEDDMRFDTFMDIAHAKWPQLAGSYDGFSFHVYPQSSGNNPRKAARHYLGAGTYFEQMVRRAQETMARHGAAGKPMIVSEIGYWMLPAKPFGLKEEEQARAVTATLSQLYASPAITGLYMHRGFDQGKLPDDARQRGIGVLDAERQPKAAMCRLVRINVGHYKGCQGFRIRLARAQFRRAHVRLRLRSNAPSLAGFQCRIDGGQWLACPAEHRIPVRKRLEVMGQSINGRLSRPFALRIGNPIKRGPKRRTRSRSAPFRIKGRHMCRLDRQPLRPCRGKFKVEGLRPGKHVMKVGPYRKRWKVLR